MATKTKIKTSKKNDGNLMFTEEELKKMTPRQRKTIIALNRAVGTIQDLKKRGIIIKPTKISE